MAVLKFVICVLVAVVDLLARHFGSLKEPNSSKTTVQEQPAGYQYTTSNHLIYVTVPYGTYEIQQ